MGSQLVFALLVLVTMSAAKLVSFKRCLGVASDSCLMTELRVDSCRSTRNGVCLLRRDHNVTVSIHYIPNFTATQMETTFFWADVPENMFSHNSIVDACLHTTCPVVGGRSNTFTYSTNVPKILPLATYRIRWKLWNREDPTQMCCLEAHAHLIN